jgi:phosphoribosylformylglycinamidine synthase I
MRYGVIVFPGGSSAPECAAALRYLGHDVELVWHGEADADLSRFDCVLLPPGHSFGDYLRPGAIAKLSPIMDRVTAYAQAGSLVVGFGNGFQILLEAGLLPGAVLMNRTRKYVCRQQRVAVQSTKSPITCSLSTGETLLMPIAHRYGNYWADDATLASMEANDQILLTYCDPEPNGSVMRIAGICNSSHNVVGAMVQPHRAVFADLGSTDGARLFESIACSCCCSKTEGGNARD